MIMKSGGEITIKVAMICHFSTQEVREHLPLNKSRYLYTIIRKLLGLSRKVTTYSDIAPWDLFLINAMRLRKDIELHVISAHSGMKQRSFSYKEDGIYYSFFECEFSNLLKRIIPSDCFWRKINPLAFRISKKVKEINPDIVLLVGAENAYYSSSVLKILDFPIYLLCQTVYNNPEFGKLSKKNASTELEILKKEKYVGVYSEKHYNLLRQLGYNNYIFSFQWPLEGSHISVEDCNEKQYDFINFGIRMSRNKGFHDSVKALAIVKMKYPQVRLNLIDGGDDINRKEINELIDSLGLRENVIFTPFFAEKKDLLKHIQLARFAVLPCKVDYISGTQLECMEYGIPVVCYKTAGTPSLNEKKECVLIAELNNVEELAEKMIMLMDNPKMADLLQSNSSEFILKRQMLANENMPRLVDNFRAIINNYYHSIPIPEEQLFATTSNV